MQHAVKFVRVFAFTSMSVQISLKFFGLRPYVACGFVKSGAIQMLGRDMQMLEPFNVLLPSAIGFVAFAISLLPLSLCKLHMMFQLLMFESLDLLTHAIDLFSVGMLIL